jgi:hypothetical protein
MKITDSSVTSHRNTAGIRDDVSSYDFKEGGLPCSIPSNDCNAIAHADGEVNPAEELVVAI